MAVPRLYTNWFATKLELSEPTKAHLNLPFQKGKKLNRTQLIAELNKGLKDWGNEAAVRIWLSQL